MMPPFDKTLSFFDQEDQDAQLSNRACSRPSSHSRNPVAIHLTSAEDPPYIPPTRESETYSGIVAHFQAELDVSRVNKIRKHLNWAGNRRHCRSIHRQRLLGRQIVVAEACELHLIWQGTTIFLKPCPSFLLRHDIWELHLCHHADLYRNAFGFLESYAYLVRHKSDLRMAKEIGLLPMDLRWSHWTRLNQAIVATGSHLVDSKGHPREAHDRWSYGELRLNRLNWIYRICCCETREVGQLNRGFLPKDQDYGSFLRRNVDWLTASTVYMILVLTAIQVGLGTHRLSENTRFDNAAAGFTVFSIVAPLTVILIVVFVMFFKALDNALFMVKNNIRNSFSVY